MNPTQSSLVDRVLGARTEDEVRRLVAQSDVEQCAAAVEPLAQELLRQLRADPRRAWQIGRAITLLAEAADDSLLRARASWVGGHALGDLLQHEGALASYRRAARIYRRRGMTHEAALVGLGQVNVLRHLGVDRPAVRLGERARAQLLRCGDRLAAARMDVNLASIHHRHERWRDALRAYDRALRLARQVGAASMERVLQFNRGGAFVQLGQLEKARQIFVQLRKDVELAGERRLLGSVEEALGALALRCGEYDRAFVHLDTARGIFEELHDPHYLLETLLELSTLLVETASYRRAASMADSALEHARLHGMPREEAQAWLLRGVASLGGGALVDAENSLREARGRLEKIGQPVSAAICRLHQAEIAVQRGHRGRARQHLDAASKTLHTEGAPLQEIIARLRLGQLACDAGLLEEATVAHGAARALLRRVPSRWLWVQTHHLAARLAECRGERAKALRSARRAARELEAMRRRISLDELRISFGEDRARVVGDAQRLLLERGQPRDLEEAFALLESSRAWEGPLADPPIPRAVSARDGRLRRRAAELAAEIDRLLGVRERATSGIRPRIAWSRVQPLIRQREAQLADLHQRLALVAHHHGARQASREVTLRELAQRLPDDVALVSYLVQETKTWAFVIERGGVRCEPLPIGSSRLADRLESLRFQLGKRSFGRDYRRARAEILQRQLDVQLQQLCDEIWSPLAIEAARVWVLPQGPLHGVPFDALPLSCGGRVIDHHKVSRLATAAAALAPAVSARRSRPDHALILGVGDPGIPRIDEEIEQVRSSLESATVLRNEAATRSTFAQLAPQATIVHVASHGIHRHDDPWFSALRLGDGWMNLYEIEQLRLSARLVVLSACDSGPVRQNGGEELQGLVSGFLRAGARNLLVSLWSVDDEAASSLMQRFYAGVASGKPFAAALREAKVEMAAEWPDPFDWGGFVLISSEMYQTTEEIVC